MSTECFLISFPVRPLYFSQDGMLTMNYFQSITCISTCCLSLHLQFALILGRHIFTMMSEHKQSMLAFDWTFQVLLFLYSRSRWPKKKKKKRPPCVLLKLAHSVFPILSFLCSVYNFCDLFWMEDSQRAVKGGWKKSSQNDAFMIARLKGKVLGLGFFGFFWRKCSNKMYLYSNLRQGSHRWQE